MNRYNANLGGYVFPDCEPPFAVDREWVVAVVKVRVGGAASDATWNQMLDDVLTEYRESGGIGAFPIRMNRDGEWESFS